MLGLSGFRNSRILLLQFLEFGVFDLIHIFPLKLYGAKLRLISDHCIYALFDTDFKSKGGFGFAFFDKEII